MWFVCCCFVCLFEGFLMLNWQGSFGNPSVTHYAVALLITGSSSTNAGHQKFSRCHTKGESEECIFPWIPWQKISSEQFCIDKLMHFAYRIITSGDPFPPPPNDQNFLNFMQFLGKSGKFVCWRPCPGGLAPPPTGNPGSAPAYWCKKKSSLYQFLITLSNC